MMLKIIRRCILPFLICFTTLQTHAQLDLGDLKFDYSNTTIPGYPLIRKFEKKDKLYVDFNNTFKYNYPAEIENASGGVWYPGKLSVTFTKQPAEADFRVVSVFDGLQSWKAVRDEAITNADGTKSLIRNYALVYPVTMKIYYNGQEYKTIDFFTATSPLNFRFTKELADPAVTAPNTPFASVQELTNYEASVKLNKAAEKFAYFEALKKVDEITKNYIGSFDYDFPIGPVVVKKKKAGDYPDLKEASELLEDGIKAYKKSDLHTRDSLLNTALQKYEQINGSSDPRINPLAREVIQYNMLVCYAVLENIAKAEEYLAKHLSSKIQTGERNTGNYITWFITWLKARYKLKNDAVIHF